MWLEFRRVVFRSWQFNLLTELFYTTLNDVFVLEGIGNDIEGVQTLERRNGSGAKVYGLNLDGKIAYANLMQLQVGFTLQKSRYNELEKWSEEDDAELVKNMLRTPNDYGYMTLTVNPWRKLQIVANGVYTGRMWVSHFAGYIEEDRLERTKRFFDFNLKASYDFKLAKSLTLQVNGGVQNIFDSRQRDFDKGEFRDSKYFYGPAQPRTVFIGLKLFN